MKLMQKPVILAALLFPTIAFAQIGVGDVAGADEAQILAFLEADGYTIVEVKTEGMELEVEALLDGVLFEIEVDLETGQIAEIEDEDDDGEDADGEAGDGDA